MAYLLNVLKPFPFVKDDNSKCCHMMDIFVLMVEKINFNVNEKRFEEKTLSFTRIEYQNKLGLVLV